MEVVQRIKAYQNVRRGWQRLQMPMNFDKPMQKWQVHKKDWRQSLLTNLQAFWSIRLSSSGVPQNFEWITGNLPHSSNMCATIFSCMNTNIECKYALGKKQKKQTKKEEKRHTCTRKHQNTCTCTKPVKANAKQKCETASTYHHKSEWCESIA